MKWIDSSANKKSDCLLRRRNSFCASEDIFDDLNKLTYGSQFINEVLLKKFLVMAKASVVLSFHEVLIHRSDLELLNGPHWLNDTIISFYFEYLERIKFASASELLFVSPEVTQCIKMVDTEEIKTFLEPLGIDRKKFIFFALNDNDLPDRAGGSHWSLLVYAKPENCFYHLDSSSGSNHNVAWEFASHLMEYLTRGVSVNFVNKECLQQSNGYDCGVHVIFNTERLAECTHQRLDIGSCDMVNVTMNPSTKRREILSIIQNLSSSQL